MGNVIWLHDNTCHQSDIAGGKGASLGRMSEAGMPVPPGFVVSAEAFRASLGSRGVAQEVRRLAESFDQPGESGLAERIQRLVLETAPTGRLAEEIGTAYAELGNNAFVAVRSSACSEDGEAASFAGQQESFLNVQGAESVIRRIVDCWASFFSERALFYRKSKGSLSDLGMAVVVQKQLSSDKSGVMFTTDPIRQRRDQMVIEATLGLGEALVSGLVTPDHYVARRDGRLKKARIGRQDQMIVRNVDEGTSTVDLDAETAAARVLSEEEIATLVEMGIRLETAFGAPQDVEWAYEGDELFVLQSRPITT